MGCWVTLNCYWGGESVVKKGHNNICGTNKLEKNDLRFGSSVCQRKTEQRFRCHSFLSPKNKWFSRPLCRSHLFVYSLPLCPSVDCVFLHAWHASSPIDQFEFVCVLAWCGQMLLAPFSSPPLSFRLIKITRLFPINEFNHNLNALKSIYSFYHLFSIVSCPSKRPDGQSSHNLFISAASKVSIHWCAAPSLGCRLSWRAKIIPCRCELGILCFKLASVSRWRLCFLHRAISLHARGVHLRFNSFVMHSILLAQLRYSNVPEALQRVSPMEIKYSRKCSMWRCSFDGD